MREERRKGRPRDGKHAAAALEFLFFNNTYSFAPFPSTGKLPAAAWLCPLALILPHIGPTREKYRIKQKSGIRTKAHFFSFFVSSLFSVCNFLFVENHYTRAHKKRALFVSRC